MKVTADSQSKTIANFFSLSLFKVSNYLLPVITLPIISRIIGPDYYGVINYVLAFVYYFVIFINAGFDVYAIRKIVSCKDDKDEVGRVISNILMAKTLIFLACTAVFALLVFTVPELKSQKLVSWFAYIYCIGWVINPSWLFHSMQDSKKFAVFSFLSRLVFSIAVVLVVRERSDYIYHPLITSLAHVGVSLYSLKYALSRYGYSLSWPPLAHVKAIFRENINISAIELIRNQILLTNIIIAGFLLSSGDTGFYTAALRIVYIVQTIISMPLNTVLFPYIGEAFVGSVQQGMDRVRKVFPYISILAVGMSVGTLLLSKEVILLMFGAEFATAIPLLRIFSIGLLLSNLNMALGQHILLQLKLDAVYTRLMLVALAANIFLLFWLTQVKGALGAAWAWPLAELLLFVLLCIYLKWKEIRVLDLNYYKPKQFYTNAIKLLPFRS